MGTTVTRKNGVKCIASYWEFCNIRGVFIVDLNVFFMLDT